MRLEKKVALVSGGAEGMGAGEAKEADPTADAIGVGSWIGTPEVP